uniref:Uncharacterized protein n=1 Tax=Anguilla anguilla TaxID=7936 RepID=A0A0E9X4V5_ANGAN
MFPQSTTLRLLPWQHTKASNVRSNYNCTHQNRTNFLNWCTVTYLMMTESFAFLFVIRIY